MTPARVLFEERMSTFPLDPSLAAVINGGLSEDSGIGHNRVLDIIFWTTPLGGRESR